MSCGQDSGRLLLGVATVFSDNSLNIKSIKKIEQLAIHGPTDIYRKFYVFLLYIYIYYIDIIKLSTS